MQVPRFTATEVFIFKEIGNLHVFIFELKPVYSHEYLLNE